MHANAATDMRVASIDSIVFSSNKQTYCSLPTAQQFTDSLMNVAACEIVEWVESWFTIEAVIPFVVNGGVYSAPRFIPNRILAVGGTA